MKSVYVREEVCMGCGIRPGYCQRAHSRSKDFILCWNGDFGGKAK